jgi:hypothetical protein
MVYQKYGSNVITSYYWYHFYMVDIKVVVVIIVIHYEFGVKMQCFGSHKNSMNMEPLKWNTK